MTIYELDPIFKVGPVEIGRRKGQKITEFPKEITFKAKHLAGGMYDTLPDYETHSRRVIVHSPDVIQVLRNEENDCHTCGSVHGFLPFNRINREPEVSVKFYWENGD